MITEITAQEQPFSIWIAFKWVPVGEVFQSADRHLWIKESAERAVQFDPIEDIQSQKVPSLQFVWIRPDVAAEIKAAHAAGLLNAPEPAPPTTPPDTTLFNRIIDKIDYVVWLVEVVVYALRDCIFSGDWLNRMRQMWRTIRPKKTAGPMFDLAITIRIGKNGSDSHV